jgi:hypothetical protein
VDGFEVDLDELGAARDKVGRLAAELTGPPREVPGAEAFGHERLAKAVNEFAAREQRGLTRLAGEAKSFHHGLSETIRTYRDTDEDSADRFGESDK